MEFGVGGLSSYQHQVQQQQHMALTGGVLKQPATFIDKTDKEKETQITQIFGEMSSLSSPQKHSTAQLKGRTQQQQLFFPAGGRVSQFSDKRDSLNTSYNNYLNPPSPRVLANRGSSPSKHVFDHSSSSSRTSHHNHHSNRPLNSPNINRFRKQSGISSESESSAAESSFMSNSEQEHESFQQSPLNNINGRNGIFNGMTKMQPPTILILNSSPTHAATTTATLTTTSTAAVTITGQSSNQIVVQQGKNENKNRNSYKHRSNRNSSKPAGIPAVDPNIFLKKLQKFEAHMQIQQQAKPHHNNLHLPFAYQVESHNYSSSHLQRSKNRSLDHFFRYFTNVYEFTHSKFLRSLAENQSENKLTRNLQQINNISPLMQKRGSILNSKKFSKPQTDISNSNRCSVLEGIPKAAAGSLLYKPAPNSQFSIFDSGIARGRASIFHREHGMKGSANNNNASPSVTASTGTNKNNNGQQSIFLINGKTYKQRNNIEAKMQLRRRSCCCAHCGQLTTVEHQRQNIVNPIVVTKPRKNLTKVIKIVSFLNKMNRAVAKKRTLLPTTAPLIPSLSDHVENQHEPPDSKGQEGPNGNGEGSNSSRRHSTTTTPVKQSPRTVQSLLDSTAFGSDAIRKAAKLLSDDRPPLPFRSNSRLKKSQTIIIKGNGNKKNDQNVQQVEKQDNQSEDEVKLNRTRLNSAQSKHKQTKNTTTKTTTTATVQKTKQNSFRERGRCFTQQDEQSHYSRDDEIDENNSNSNDDEEMDTKRRSFMKFVESKIQEAKKKRKEEPIRYVGKTPLSMLFKLLAKGKRDSPFDKEATEKRVNNLIAKKPVIITTAAAAAAAPQTTTMTTGISEQNTSATWLEVSAAGIHDITSQQSLYSRRSPQIQPPNPLHLHHQQQHPQINVVGLPSDDFRQKDSSAGRVGQSVVMGQEQNNLSSSQTFSSNTKSNQQRSKEEFLKQRERGFYISPIVTANSSNALTGSSTSLSGIRLLTPSQSQQLARNNGQSQQYQQLQQYHQSHLQYFLVDESDSRRYLKPVANPKYARVQQQQQQYENQLQVQQEQSRAGWSGSSNSSSSKPFASTSYNFLPSSESAVEKSQSNLRERRAHVHATSRNSINSMNNNTHNNYMKNAMLRTGTAVSRSGSLPPNKTHIMYFPKSFGLQRSAISIERQLDSSINKEYQSSNLSLSNQSDSNNPHVTLGNQQQQQHHLNQPEQQQQFLQKVHEQQSYQTQTHHAQIQLVNVGSDNGNGNLQNISNNNNHLLDKQTKMHTLKDKIIDGSDPKTIHKFTPYLKNLFVKQPINGTQNSHRMNEGLQNSLLLGAGSSRNSTRVSNTTMIERSMTQKCLKITSGILESPGMFLRPDTLTPVKSRQQQQQSSRVVVTQKATKTEAY